jgi:DNA-directed RNA polymerase subunit H (RpoH/RPB5)
MKFLLAPGTTGGGKINIYGKIPNHEVNEREKNNNLLEQVRIAKGLLEKHADTPTVLENVKRREGALFQVLLKIERDYSHRSGFSEEKQSDFEYSYFFNQEQLTSEEKDAFEEYVNHLDPLTITSVIKNRIQELEFYLEGVKDGGGSLPEEELKKIHKDLEELDELALKIEGAL